MTAPAGLNWLKGLDPATAECELRACCAAPSWIGTVVAGRPYAFAAGLSAAAHLAVDDLDGAGQAEALAAHPRIGERAAGTDRESVRSRREQAATSDAGDDALAAGNAEYERRFGHVFLTCANGRGAEEILTALQSRLGNDPAIKWGVVRAELREITRLRLHKLLDEHDDVNVSR